MLNFIPLLLKTVGGPISKAISKKITSKEDALELEQEIQKELLNYDFASLQGQLAINLQESKSESIFVSGWRPCVGWVCALALAYHYIIIAFLDYFIKLFAPETPALPEIDINALYPLLLGMLGIGGARTLEKMNGVNKNR